MKRVLMVAFHFPPLAGSSGIQRALRFVQHLPRFGWEPIVLTADPRAYEATSPDLLREIPPATVVERAFALDTARHLSLAGRYPGFLARPDRWMTWRFDAVRRGARLVRTLRPAAIWSTYPIATAHRIGAALARGSGLPWVADFRDPMVQDGYPEDPRTWASFNAIEQEALRRAARSVFTTPGAAARYRGRYPEVPPGRIAVLENGYDEESFAAVERAAAAAGPIDPGAVTLLHSGIVYPSERDPTQFFVALRRLLDSGRLGARRVRVVLRASAHDAFLRGQAARLRLEETVEIAPAIPYRAALEEMLRADGLLVMQAANCNEQIPAKLYEYLRAGRPVLGLTDAAGDTAAVLRDAGLDDLAPLDDAAAIERALERFVVGILDGSGRRPEPGYVATASRAARTEALARMLEEVAGDAARDGQQLSNSG